jgi:hypothetical protein
MMNVRDDRLKEAREYIMRVIAGRKMTDRIVSWLWILVPVLILLILGVIAIALFAYSALSMFSGGMSASDGAVINLFAEILIMSAGVVATAVFAYLAYVLVRRQNDHFSRDRALREGIIRLLRTASDPSGRSSLVMNELAAMSGASAPKEDYHDERIWGLLMTMPLIMVALIFLVILYSAIGPLPMVAIIVLPVTVILAIGQFLATYYMFYFLGKQMREHDDRWLVFEQNARAIISKLRWPPIVRMKYKRLEDRDFAIYLLLSIFIPFFVLYWWYTLIKDPNDHFESQWEFEDRLAEIIRK